MRFIKLFIALCTLLCFARKSFAQPIYGSSYKVTATMNLPYAHIAEPITSYYDAVHNKQRTEFYNGLDTYIYRADMGVQWQVNPVVSSNQCFTTTGLISLTSLIPDVSHFILQPNNVVINGVECQDYQYVNVVGEKTNTYDFYVSAADGFTPVRYQMMGYDSLLGSHYDLYILDYSSYTAVAFDQNDAKFNSPAGLNCGPFPGPGASTGVNPMDEISMHFPSSSSSSDAGVSKAFSDFMNAFGKNYATAEEKVRRANIFENNKKYIDLSNHKHTVGGKSLRLAVNHLADLSEVEMGRYRGISSAPRASNEERIKGALKVHTPESEQIDKLPSSVDWRVKGAVNPPKDQGICGSCWSFGTAGTLEGQYFMKTGSLLKFSEQELVDCSWGFGNNGCDGGEDFRAYGWIAQNGGLATTDDYGPYLMVDGQCKNSTRKTLHLRGYTVVNPGDEIALLDAIASVGPISVAIDASHRSLSFYSSGVYYEPECKNDVNDLDHAVLAVGYGTDTTTNESYWLIKNSWSTYWGDQGYVKMSRKNNNCGVATSPTYPVLLDN